MDGASYYWFVLDKSVLEKRRGIEPVESFRPSTVHCCSHSIYIWILSRFCVSVAASYGKLKIELEYIILTT
jgi:hypothetical protein